MTLLPEQVQAMSAGPEMNAAVAESVMGWTRFPYMMPTEDGKGEYVYCPPGRVHISTVAPVPDFSGNIAAAFELQAEIARCGLAGKYGKQLALLLSPQACPFELSNIYRANREEIFVIANASPLDRCKAALIVKANQQEGQHNEKRS